MKTIFKTLLLTPALVMMLASTNANAFQNCHQYAQTAIKQQHQNFVSSCRFEGLRWHSNFNAHKAFCQTFGSDIAWQGTRDRAADLLQCMNRNGAQNRFGNNEVIIPVNNANRFNNNEVLLPVRGN